MHLSYAEIAPSAQYDWFKAFLGAQGQLFTEQCNRSDNPKFRISLPVIKYCGVVFRLNQPIDVSLCAEDGLWICENEMLGSIASGSTPERAVHAFCEDFTVLWEQISKTPNDALAPDAQGIKAHLSALVKAVEKEA
jgi:hypothetical protein